MKFTGDMDKVIAEAIRRTENGENIVGISIDKDTLEVEFLTPERTHELMDAGAMDLIGGVDISGKKDKCDECPHSNCPKHPDNDDDPSLGSHVGDRQWN